MFSKEVKKVWENTQVEGWAGYIIIAKPRALKLALKKYNSEVFGNVESKIKDAEPELHTIDLWAESRILNEEQVARKKEVVGLVWKFRKRKEWLWLQKLRLDWALKGDKNTRFFLVMATLRQSRNMINSMKIWKNSLEEFSIF
ncbi:hypothetical protein ACSBR2_019750 [Camellia fascicularis]